MSSKANKEKRNQEKYLNEIFEKLKILYSCAIRWIFDRLIILLDACYRLETFLSFDPVVLHVVQILYHK